MRGGVEGAAEVCGAPIGVRAVEVAGKCGAYPFCKTGKFCDPNWYAPVDPVLSAAAEN